MAQLSPCRNEANGSGIKANWSVRLFCLKGAPSTYKMGGRIASEFTSSDLNRYLQIYLPKAGANRLASGSNKGLALDVTCEPFGSTS